MNNENKLICKNRTSCRVFNEYFRGQIQKRKDRIDSQISKTSSAEDQLQFSLNLDDIQKQKGMKKDQLHVIEQFFPDASILGPPFLIPYLPDNQKRMFMQLDFSTEEYIEDYSRRPDQSDRDHRRDVKRQMKTHRDTAGDKEAEDIISDTETEEEQKQATLSTIPSDALIEGEKVMIEDRSIETPEKMFKQEFVERELKKIQETMVQPSVEERRSEEDQTKIKSATIEDNVIHETDVQLSLEKDRSKEDQTIKSSITKIDVVHEIDAQPIEDQSRKPSVKTSTSDQLAVSLSRDRRLPSSKSIEERLPPSKSTSTIPPNTTQELITDLTES